MHVRNIYMNSILFFIFCTFLLLCINYAPAMLRMNTLSSGFSVKLSWYPMLGVSCLWIYDYFIKKNRKIIIDRYLLYILCYCFFLFVGECIGLIRFPYYQQLVLGSISQIEKAPLVMHFFDKIGFQCTDEEFILGWFTIRQLRSGMSYILYTWVFALVLGYYISIFWNRSIMLIKRAVYISIIVIVFCAIIELFYLMGNEMAKYVLVHITPYFHEVYSDGRDYPPLLWYTPQIRSIFIEPSNFGMYAVLVNPLLWVNILKNTGYKKIAWGICSIVFTFFVFLSQARTSTLLLILQFAVLIFLIVYKKNNCFKNITAIFVPIIISFLLSIMVISNFIITPVGDNKHALTTKVENNNAALMTEITEYADNNITSVVDSGENANRKGSNTTRKAIYITNLNIGLDYPLFGVGYKLNGAYFVDYMPLELTQDNAEIQKWIGYMKAQGIMRYTLPNIGEYVTKFSSTGIIGVLFLVFPWIYVGLKLLSKLRRYSQANALWYDSAWIFIGLVGVFVSGFGDEFVFYTPWAVLALSFAILKQYDKNKFDVKS